MEYHILGYSPRRNAQRVSKCDWSRTSDSSNIMNWVSNGHFIILLKGKLQSNNTAELSFRTFLSRKRLPLLECTWRGKFQGKFNCHRHFSLLSERYKKSLYSQSMLMMVHNLKNHPHFSLFPSSKINLVPTNSALQTVNFVTISLKRKFYLKLNN